MHAKGSSAGLMVAPLTEEVASASRNSHPNSQPYCQ